MDMKNIGLGVGEGEGDGGKDDNDGDRDDSDTDVGVGVDNSNGFIKKEVDVLGVVLETAGSDRNSSNGNSVLQIKPNKPVINHNHNHNVPITMNKPIGVCLLSDEDIKEIEDEMGQDFSVVPSELEEDENSRIAHVLAAEHGYSDKPLSAASNNSNLDVETSKSNASKATTTTSTVNNTNTVKGKKMGSSKNRADAGAKAAKAAAESAERVAREIVEAGLSPVEYLYGPFLRVEKGRGRRIFIDSDSVDMEKQSSWDVCLWALFQLYGRAGRAGASDSAVVRGYVGVMLY